jgi:hypothetical protein
MGFKKRKSEDFLDFYVTGLGLKVGNFHRAHNTTAFSNFHITFVIWRSRGAAQFWLRQITNVIWKLENETTSKSLPLAHFLLFTVN